jgi:hypothetical protein
MSVERVPVPEMPSYLERFSRGHEGWLTHVEVEGEPRGDEEISEQPLDGIVADLAQNRLLVFLENADRGASTRYCIERPTEIWRETSGETLRLEVASADGSTTVVECHPAGH